MKTCPVCHARCFDDMEVCYGCLHRFSDDERAPETGGGISANADQTARQAVVREASPCGSDEPAVVAEESSRPCGPDASERPRTKREPKSGSPVPIEVLVSPVGGGGEEPDAPAGNRFPEGAQIPLPGGGAACIQLVINVRPPALSETSPVL